MALFDYGMALIVGNVTSGSLFQRPEVENSIGISGQRCTSDNSMRPQGMVMPLRNLRCRRTANPAIAESPWKSFQAASTHNLVLKTYLERLGTAIVSAGDEDHPPDR